MGVLRPLINRAQTQPDNRTVALSNKIATLPNAMTAARPLLGLYVAKRLLQGKPRTMPSMLLAGATDMEGWGARFIDKTFPQSGRGATKIGEGGDPIADTLLLLEVGGAALAAPRVNILGKLAVSVILAQETQKALWAVNTAKTYHRYAGGKIPIKTTIDGKEAMAEKILAGGLATWTNDFEDPLIRVSLGAASLGFAIAGALRGHREFLKYQSTAEDIIARVQNYDAYKNHPSEG